MHAEQSILDIIQRRQVKWYGLLLRIDDSCWPNKIKQWTPHGRRRRGRPQQSWKNQVTELMRSRNMEEDMAEETSLVFGSGWTALRCIDPYLFIYYYIIFFFSRKMLAKQSIFDRIQRRQLK